MKRKKESDYSSPVKKTKTLSTSDDEKCLGLPSLENTFLSLFETDCTAGLTYYLSAAKSRNGGEHQAFLRGYLEKNPSCHHILSPLALEKEKRTQDVLLLCFQCLERVLLFTASPSLPAESATPRTLDKQYHTIGSQLVASILSSHMRCIYSSLQSTQPIKLVASCLKLLTAMVLQGPTTARDIQKSFNFGYKPLEMLPSRTRLLEGMTESVRLCYMNFALSFLVVGDCEVVSSVLGLKGFLTSFFKHLPKDSLATSQLFLTALMQKVVLNTDISKRIKSSFFNQYVLKQAVQLLLKEFPSSDSGDEALSFRQLVLEFLLSLCTNFQSGICYKSKPPPHGLEKTNNPVILHFLLSLSGSLDNPLVQQLLTNTLCSCHDLYLTYFKSLTLNFDPQPTSQWIETSEVMIKIVSSMPSLIDLLGLTSCDSKTPPPLTCLNTAVGLTAPSFLTRNSLSLGVQHPVPLVRYQTLRLMEVVLDRAVTIVNVWGPVRTSLSSIDSFLVSYRDSIIKCLPDVRTLISLRQQLLSSDRMEAVNVERFLPSDQLKNVEVAESDSLLGLTLDLLCSYQRLAPQLFLQVDFNVAKLLPTVTIGEKVMPRDPVVLKKTLQILLDAPTGSLKWKQLSGGPLMTLLSLCVTESEEIANMAHQLAMKLIRGSCVMDDYQSELEITLLSLRAHCAAATADGQTSSVLIKFVADILIGLVQDYHLYEARLDQILCSHSLTSPNHLASLEDILSVPLDLPTSSSSSVTRYEKCTTERICPLVPCLLSKLEDGDRLHSEPVQSFIVDVLPKLLLVHRSSSCESLVAVVMDYVSSSQQMEHPSKDLHSLIELVSDWAIDKRPKKSVGGELSGRETSKNIVLQMEEPFENSNPLLFLSTLVGALHSQPGSYPLDTFVNSLADKELRVLLESCFGSVLTTDNPALLCSIRAVQVLLLRLHHYWKNTVLDDSQMSVVSFLFSLLVKTVKKLSSCDDERSDNNFSCSSEEDKLSTLFEQVVDKQLMEELFLSEEWLMELQSVHSGEKKRVRRKSGETPHVKKTVGYVCNCEIGELLRMAAKCCSVFSASDVFRMAVSRLFSCIKTVLSSSQCNSAVSNLLTRLIQMLQPSIDKKDQLNFVEDVLASVPDEKDPVELLVDVLSALLLPGTDTTLIHDQLFLEENEDDDDQSITSPLFADLTRSAVSRIISLTCAHSSKTLDVISFSVLNCKFHQAHLKQDLLQPAEGEECFTEDGLLSGVCHTTRVLLTTDMGTPSVTKHGNDLALTLSSLSQSFTTSVAIERDGLLEISKDLERSCQSSPHAKKVLELSLFNKLLHGTAKIAFVSVSTIISEEDGKMMLNHAVSNLSPTSVRIAGLLLGRLTGLLQYFMSDCVSKLCELELSSEGSSEITELYSFLFLVAHFFKVLDEIDLNGCSQEFTDILKKALKQIQKNVVRICLHLPHDRETTSALNALVVEVAQGLCRHSLKGLKRISDGIKMLDVDTSESSTWNQCQISVACHVALQSLDPTICGITVKRAMQKLATLFGDVFSREDQRLLTDVEALLQRMHSKAISLTVDLVDRQWSDFLLDSLRTKFSSCYVLKLVASVVAALPENLGQVVYDLKEIYDLIWSHPEFSTVMTAETRDDKTKECLVELLVTIIEKQPNVCHASHIGILLSAYSATRSVSDRGILYLLYQYEEHGVSTATFRPYLWGSAALEHYKQKQEVGWLLWKQPGLQEVLELLDRKCLFRSAFNFPVQVGLEPSNPFLSSSPVSEEEISDDYDPCFMLPLLSHLLDPGSVVDCRQFVDHGCLSYLLMALSSQHVEVRAASGHALTRFSAHLEGSRFREKAQIALLLEVLKNTISEPSSRVNSVIAAFCAKSTRLFLDPDNPLYPVVGHFIVYKPALDLIEIPLYNMLLHSSSVQHKAERLWLLAVMSDGLKCHEDFKAFSKKRVVSQVLSLYNSGILDQASKILVKRFIQRISCVSNSARELIFCGGLCSVLL